MGQLPHSQPLPEHWPVTLEKHPQCFSAVQVQFSLHVHCEGEGIAAEGATAAERQVAANNEAPKKQKSCFVMVSP